MAKKYKNQKNIFYEICNEPNGNVSWKTIKSYATTVIKTIRTYDKKNIILVGTPVWSQEVYLTDGGMESVILLILWQERKRYEADVLIRLTGM